MDLNNEEFNKLNNYKDENYIEDSNLLNKISNDLKINQIKIADITFAYKNYYLIVLLKKRGAAIIA